MWNSIKCLLGKFLDKSPFWLDIDWVVSQVASEHPDHIAEVIVLPCNIFLALCLQFFTWQWFTRLIPRSPLLILLVLLPQWFLWRVILLNFLVFNGLKSHLVIIFIFIADLFTFFFNLSFESSLFDGLLFCLFSIFPLLELVLFQISFFIFGCLNGSRYEIWKLANFIFDIVWLVQFSITSFPSSKALDLSLRWPEVELNVFLWFGGDISEMECQIV